MKTIKLEKIRSRAGDMIEAKNRMKLGFYFLQKIFQIKLLKPFTEIKYANEKTDNSSDSIRKGKKLSIKPKLENRSKFDLKILKNLMKLTEEKHSQRLKLGFLKLKINRLRRNRRMINKMNPYITLSITLRQIIQSKLKSSFKNLINSNQKIFSKILKANESTILPTITPCSEYVELVSDISIPSMINAINLAQQKSLNGGDKIIGDNITEISIQGMKNFKSVEETGYNSLSLNLIYKTRKSVNGKAKAEGLSQGLTKLKDIFKRKKSNYFM